jgi:hypothetical protein
LQANVVALIFVGEEIRTRLAGPRYGKNASENDGNADLTGTALHVT